MLHFSSCFGMMTGGISPLDLSKKSNMDVIKRGFGIFLREENKRLASTSKSNSFYVGIFESLKASKQVVAGIEYRVAVELVLVDKASLAGCLAGRAKDGVIAQDGFITEDDSCYGLLLATGEKKFACFTIWSRPWLLETKPPKPKESFIVSGRVGDKIDLYTDCLAVNNY